MSSQVPGTSSSQVPGTSSFQVPGTSSSEVPGTSSKIVINSVEIKVVKKTNEKWCSLIYRPNPVGPTPPSGESIGGPCLEFHKLSPQTQYIFIMDISLDPRARPTTYYQVNVGSPTASTSGKYISACSKKIRIASTCPPNTGHSPNAVSMLGQRRRRWTNNIETAMGE